MGQVACHWWGRISNMFQGQPHAISNTTASRELFAGARRLDGPSVGWSADHECRSEGFAGLFLCVISVWCVCLCMCLFLCLCLCVYVSVCLCVCVALCLCGCVSVCLCVCVSVCVYATHSTVHISFSPISRCALLRLSCVATSMLGSPDLLEAGIIRLELSNTFVTCGYAGSQPVVSGACHATGF
jgi:hypothetical protein